MIFDDQSAPPKKPTKPTPAQAAEMKAFDAAVKANVDSMNRRAPKAVKAEKKQESLTVIPGKKRGGLIRGDGCASKGKTKGRHC